MFAVAALETNNSISVIIPCENYESTFNSADRGHYLALLARATRTETLNYIEPSEQAFFAAGKVIVEKCDHLIAVWDGEASRGLGGTADVVAYAKSVGKPTTVFWPEGVRR